MEHLLKYNKASFHSDLIMLQDTLVSSQDTINPEAFPLDTITISADTIPRTDTFEIQASERDSNASIIPPPVIKTQPVIPEPSPAVNAPVPVPSSDYIPYLTDRFSVTKDNCLYFLMKSKDQYFCVLDSSRLVYSAIPQKKFSTLEKTDQNSMASLLKSEQWIKPDWLIGIIIACLLLFAWLKLFYNKFIDQTFISLWNFQLSENFQRDQSMFSRRVSLLLNLNFIVAAGLFFYLVAVFFELNPWSLPPFTVFLTSTGIVALLLACRYIISHLTGMVFDHDKLYKDYLNQILIIYKIAGIVLIPVIMAIAYLPDKLRIYLIITGLILLGLGVLFRFVKGIQLIFNKDVSIFYLILYLCTLEFLPALVIYKFFSSLV